MKALREFIFKPSTFRFSLLVSLMFFVIFFFKEERGWEFDFLDLMELKTLDIKFTDRGISPQNDQVAIAAIDEKSIQQFGRWPWNRIVIAQLIASLTEAGASVIAFDVIFSDEDNSRFPKILSSIASSIDDLEVDNCKDCEPMREAVLDFLKNEMRDSDPDKILANTIIQADNVTLGFFFFNDKKEIGFLNQEVLKTSIENIILSKINIISPWNKSEEHLYKLKLQKGLAVRTPLPIFCNATDRFGHIFIEPDEDGTIRWINLIQEVESDDKDLRLIFPSLSLSAVAAHLDAEIVLHTYPKGVDYISIGTGDDAPAIRTDWRGRLLINYHGPEGTFPTYSISDIIKGDFPENAFKDKIIVVGATATGIYDMRVTPFQETFPGVEIHANIIDNILNDNYITYPDWAYFYELFIIIFFGILFGLVLERVSAIWGALFIIFIVLSYYQIDKQFFFKNGYWVPIVLPLIQAVFLFLVCYVYRYVTEEREKNRTRAAFKQYLNESIVNVIMDDFDKLKLGGDKREISVMFSDIRSFTSLSENLSPEELGRLLTDYMNPMTSIVFDNKGVLDKYIGDAIMAFWGAPHPQEDHAIRACRSALDMSKKLVSLNTKWAEEGMPQLRIGIGINTGQMWVGNMGSHVRFDYTVLGDAVNLGARLEGTNKIYGTEIIISEFTFSQIAGYFLCRKLDVIQVKGKQLPVEIYEVIAEGVGNDNERELVRRFAKAFEHYTNKEWQKALTEFIAIKEKFSSDTPTEVFIERTKEYLQNPPPADWDGVYIMKSK